MRPWLIPVLLASGGPVAAQEKVVEIREEIVVSASLVAVSIGLALWWKDNGDAIVARVAHVLNTPYTTLLAEPISRLLRFHLQAIQLIGGEGFDYGGRDLAADPETDRPGLWPG